MSCAMRKMIQPILLLCQIGTKPTKFDASHIVGYFVFTNRTFLASPFSVDCLCSEFVLVAQLFPYWRYRYCYSLQCILFLQNLRSQGALRKFLDDMCIDTQNRQEHTDMRKIITQVLFSPSDTRSSNFNLKDTQDLFQTSDNISDSTGSSFLASLCSLLKI